MIFSSIAGILSNGLRIAADWFGGYASKQNVAARQVSEDNKDQDRFHDEIKNKDINSTRIDLS